MRAITRAGPFLVCSISILFAGGTALAQSNSCATATSVGGGGTFTGTTLGMTNDGQTTCGTSNLNPDVWFKFTTGCAGTLDVNTCGSDDLGGAGTIMDTVLSLHSACPGTGANTLTCNDQTTCNGVGSNDSAVSTAVAAGATVLIRVSTWSTTLPGAFLLNVSFTPSAVAGSLRNGDFSLGNPGWCFFDESSNGSVSYATAAAAVTGGNDFTSNRDTYIQQVFTTFDSSMHNIAFDWSFASGNSQGWDEARWDLIDTATGLSVVSGPIILTDLPGASGSVSQSFTGSGVYKLVLGTLTVDGAGGAGTSTFDNILITCDAPVDRFSNGDFSGGGASWCFTDESQSGSVSFASGAAVVTGGDDGGDLRESYIQQSFTTFDVADHIITFDWSYASTNIPPYDNGWWDLIDLGSGLSAVSGPVFLSDVSGSSGTVSQSFGGSGQYSLRLGTYTDDGVAGAGVTTFDDISIECAASVGPFDNGDFSDAFGGRWCFNDESNSGSVDFTTGAAVVIGGNDGVGNLTTRIRQTFTTYDVASHTLSFDWSYASTNSPGWDEARWDLIDEGTGLSLIAGPVMLTDIPGSSGSVSQAFTGTGVYTIVLSTWTQDGAVGPGVTTYDNVSIACDSVPGRFTNGDFAGGSASWCFQDEGDSGAADFSTGAAVVTGNDDGEFDSTAWIQQAFTTSDAATHTITFDWSYTTSNSNFFDTARMDIIDDGTGLSVFGGPVTISGADGASGTFSADFSGSGTYLLRLGTWTDDGILGAGVSTFDNISIACTETGGAFTNGDFSVTTGAPWCFTPEGPSGSVDFSGGAAVVTGGDGPVSAGGFDTFISQNFSVPAAPHVISFDWSYSSINSPTWDGAFWDLIDTATGLSVVGGPLTLANATGTGGTAVSSFTGSGNYTVILGSFTVDSLFGPGVTTFDNVTIVPEACNPVSGLVCSAAGTTANLSWTNNDSYVGILILRNAVVIATLPGTATSFSDPALPPGSYNYSVQGNCVASVAAPENCNVTIVPPLPSFRRGDANNDALINIADAIYLLANLFPGGNPPSVLFCMDACDANDDDIFNIADPISLLAALFGSPSVPLPAPYPLCGVDPTPGVLGCATTACP